MNKTFKFLAAGVSTACAFGAMANETAFEGQPIGSIEVRSTTVNTIVAVAFKELSADTTQSVSVSNILSTVNLQAGDKVFVYQKVGSSYSSWILSGNAPNLYWEKVQNVSQDANGDSSSDSGTDASASRPNIGEGFWLVRTTANSRDLDLPFYIFGAAVQTDATRAAGGVKSLLGNPKNAAATLTTEGACLGDTVSLVANNGALMKEYKYVKINGEDKWAILKSVGALIPEYVAQSVTIPAGQGLWYNSTGPTEVTLNWDVSD